ncbi:MAG: hypothetical protein AAGH74_09960, partial [Pseudomonadota bacterium]
RHEPFSQLTNCTEGRMLSFINFSPATFGPVETALVFAAIPLIAGLLIGLRRETSVFLGVVGAITAFAVQ